MELDSISHVVVCCFGSESAVQLTPAEITALQVGTQRAWSKALRLLVRHNHLEYQA